MMPTAKWLDTPFLEGGHQRNASKFFAWGGLQSDDLVDQNFSIILFGSCQFVLPRWPRLRDGIMKGRNITLILHIQPLCSPFGDRFIDMQDKVDGGAPKREADSRVETANIEKLLEKTKVWMNAKIAFTQSEEYREVEKRVCGQLMKL